MDTIKELGGYLELEHFSGREYHEGLLALDSARNALAYLIEARSIKRLWIPSLLCGSVATVAKQNGVDINAYPIDEDFLPVRSSMDVEPDDYVYLVDYYGLLPDESISAAAAAYPGHLIVDEVMAFFRRPLPGVDTIYSCRKFFGVSDGAYLSTDASLDRELERDESWDKMGFVLGRFERPASEFYAESKKNNSRFRDHGVRLMSPITQNLLRAIDYEGVLDRRRRNFAVLRSGLDDVNKLCFPDPLGPFMYPFFMEEGRLVRSELHRKKIYVPMLWDWAENAPGFAGLYANDILPLPLDQRYNEDDMARIVEVVRGLL